MIKVTAPVRIDISPGWSDADPFRNQFGGAVLNAAINMRVSATLDKKNLISSLEKVPMASGLGTSGALRTVYLVAANPNLLRDKIDLINRVHIFENAIVGQRAGFQDQAAAIFGGVNYWHFRKNDGIRRVEIPKWKSKHLHDRLVLVFTGDRHLSSNVHEQVFGGKKYMAHILTINRMKIIAKEMLKHISNEKKMAELIRESWILQKSLNPNMETKTMKKLQELTKECYLACRATGAGGGGCMIFYTNEKAKLVRALNKINGNMPKMRVLDFEFDYRGLEISK